VQVPWPRVSSLWSWSVAQHNWTRRPNAADHDRARAVVQAAFTRASEDCGQTVKQHSAL
jgi:hypothetical protein